YGRTQVSPLASPILRAATAFMEPEQIERGQVLADIVLNCAPELGEYPFDKPTKAFTKEHSDNAVHVSDPLEGVEGGAVYLPAQAPPTPETLSSSRALDLLNDDFQENLEAARSLALFSDA